MLLTLISGLLTALLALPFAAGPLPYRWALLAAPVLLVMLHPRILNRILARLLRMARQPALDTPITAGTVIKGLAWAFGGWLCFGLQIWILAVRLGAAPGRTAALAVGGFAFAWSAGFLVVFVPAGAGVRDVLLLLLLSPVLGIPAATAVALVSRLLLTVADVLSAGISLSFARPAGRSPSEPGPPSEPGRPPDAG
jgi:glycosyltransferase 2 family protein